MRPKPQRRSIEFEKGSLSYLSVGNGKDIILAFHGFGQSAEMLYHFAEFPEDKFTVFYFDHFFHGQSKWEPVTPIPSEFFGELIDRFLEQEKITKFNIMAYSLGGKWAHSVVRFHPEKVKKVFLCAPDGAKTTFYYSFSTRNSLGRYLFRKTTKNPKPFFKILKFFFKAGILSKSLYRFVYLQMGVESRRKQVYKTWMQYTDFKGLSETTIETYNKYKIPIKILVGTYDRVIKPEWMKPFTYRIPTLELEEIKKGHRSLLDSIGEKALNFLGKE